MNPQSLCWLGRMAIRSENIVRLEADRNYTWIYLHDGQKILMSHTMSFYETRLPPQFVRVHRGHCINIDYLMALNRYKPHFEIELANGQRIPVARRRWTFLKNQLTKL